ncbi:MAG: flavin reductase family protein [Eubacterium sp.]
MFKEIKLSDIEENMVSLFRDQWALVTAGNSDKLNTMTVSWGAVGELWGMDMATIYIRPQRYTEEFLDKEDYFTVTFYPQEKKDILRLCGAKSGRDIDKVKECKLTPCFDDKAPYFKEAKIVLICRKVAKSRFNPDEIIDKSIIDKWYEIRDFHYIYQGAVEKVLISE